MDKGWTISIDATTDTDLTDEQLERLVGLFRSNGGALTRTPDLRRIGVTMSNDDGTLDAVNAGAQSAGMFIDRLAIVGHGRCAIVRLEVITWAEHDAELDRPNVAEMIEQKNEFFESFRAQR